MRQRPTCHRVKKQRQFSNLAGPLWACLTTCGTKSVCLFGILYNFRFIGSEVRPALAQPTTVSSVHVSKNLSDSLDVELQVISFLRRLFNSRLILSTCLELVPCQRKNKLSPKVSDNDPRPILHPVEQSGKPSAFFLVSTHRKRDRLF